MSNTVHFRVCGREFSGPADDLVVLDQARAYARGYLDATVAHFPDPATQKINIFQVDPTDTCKPILHETVRKEDLT